MAAVDDVYESWEDMDDIGLERKISNFLSTVPDDCSNKNQIMSSGPVKVVIDMNGSIGAQLMDQQPAVKILKRPVGVNGSHPNGECKARPVKTLKQRQQEYEQARLRILGEARSPEDVAEENITNLQLKMEANSIQSTNRIKEKTSLEILSPKTSLPKNSLPPQPRVALVAPAPPPLVSLLRTPLGPDGTRGFTLKR